MQTAKVPHGQQEDGNNFGHSKKTNSNCNSLKDYPPRENLEKLKKVKECEGARRVKTMATILGNNCNNANVNVWQQLKQWQQCQCVVAATLRLFNFQSNDYHHNNHYHHHNHNYHHDNDNTLHKADTKHTNLTNNKPRLIHL